MVGSELQWNPDRKIAAGEAKKKTVYSRARSGLTRLARAWTKAALATSAATWRRRKMSGNSRPSRVPTWSAPTAMAIDSGGWLSSRVRW